MHRVKKEDEETKEKRKKIKVVVKPMAYLVPIYITRIHKVGNEGRK
jgi:hypothetical protein